MITDNGVALMFWVGAEPPVSILGSCLPVIFYLTRVCARDGFSSLFSTSASSKERSSGTPQKSWSSRRLKLSENGIKLPNESFTSAEDVDHEGTAMKYYSQKGTTYDEENFPPNVAKPGAITVRHEFDIRSSESGH